MTKDPDRTKPPERKFESFDEALTILDDVDRLKTRRQRENLLVGAERMMTEFIKRGESVRELTRCIRMVRGCENISRGEVTSALKRFGLDRVIREQVDSGTRILQGGAAHRPKTESSTSARSRTRSSVPNRKGEGRKHQTKPHGSGADSSRTEVPETKATVGTEDRTPEASDDGLRGRQQVGTTTIVPPKELEPHAKLGPDNATASQPLSPIQEAARRIAELKRKKAIRSRQNES